MLDALAIHEAAHAVINTVRGLSVCRTFITPSTRNGRTEYEPELSQKICQLLQSTSLDPDMKAMANKIGIAAAAGYVAEACHRGVVREAICSTPDSPGYSDREQMGSFCAKLQLEQDAQFRKWEDEAESLIKQHGREIAAVADALRKKPCLTGAELQSLIADSLKSSSGADSQTVEA